MNDIAIKQKLQQVQKLAEQKKVDMTKLEDQWSREYYDLQIKTIQVFQQEHPEEYEDLKTKMEDKQERASNSNQKGSKFFNIMVERNLFLAICDREKRNLFTDFQSYREEKIRLLSVYN